MAVDLMPILNAFAASDVVIGVMSVAATLAGIYMVIFACMNLLAMLRGGEAWSWGLASHLDSFEKSSRDKEFKRRHQREEKSREYREWKKSKGL
jgi:hypothetical protein